MFTQIIKIIWNQRKSNVWIWGEILLVSVCLWYVVDDLYTRTSLYFSPLGYDITHTYQVELGILTDENSDYHPQEEYGTTMGDDLVALVDRMRTCPGVEAVGISFSSIPYSYMRSYNSGIRRIRPETGDTLLSGSVRRFQATSDYVRVFRYATPQGDTEALAEGLAPSRIILTRDMEEELYPEGDATGKLIDIPLGDSTDTRIGGVMNPIRFADFDTYTPTFIMPMSESFIARYLNPVLYDATEITLRVAPQADTRFAETFRKEMKNQLRYHNFYLLDIQPFGDIRAKYIRGDVNDMKMYLAGVFFLLINIFLGIVGTFWFRTQHRQGEMGLRIALGSTPGGLRSLLVGEGFWLLLAAFVPAALIALNLGLREIVNVEIMPFTAGRFLLCQGMAFGLLLLMIAAGIWFPSRKAVNLQPAEALHYE